MFIPAVWKSTEVGFYEYIYVMVIIANGFSKGGCCVLRIPERQMTAAINSTITCNILSKNMKKNFFFAGVCSVIFSCYHQVWDVLRFWFSLRFFELFWDFLSFFEIFWDFLLNIIYFFAIFKLFFWDCLKFFEIFWFFWDFLCSFWFLSCDSFMF